MARPPKTRHMPVHSVFRKAPPHPALDYRPPRALRIARTATFTFLALSVATIAYVLWWYALSVTLLDNAEAWIRDRGADGMTVSRGKMEVTGFPFHLRLVIAAPSVSGAGDWSWSAEAAHLETAPIPFTPLTFTPVGEQRLTVPTAAGPVAFVGTAGAVEVEVDQIGRSPETIRIRLADVLLQSGAGSAVGARSATVRLDMPKTASADHQTVSATLSVQGEGLRLPTESGLPLGDTLDAVTLDARLMGALQGGVPLAETLSRWRDNGGTVEIAGLNIHYGPLSAGLSGTLALDGTLQPVGAATAKARGFFETIDQLRARGLVEAKPALTAKLVLGALARKDPNGGAPVFNLPLSIQENTLYVGPVPLISLPEIRWPGGEGIQPSPQGIA